MIRHATHCVIQTFNFTLCCFSQFSTTSWWIVGQKSKALRLWNISYLHINYISVLGKNLDRAIIKNHIISTIKELLNG